MSDSPRERAVAALDSDDRPPTARVFAARRAIHDSEASLQTVVERYATDQSRHRFHPPEAVKRDIRRICRAAAEQRVEVDAEAVIEQATPDDAAAVRARARQIRQHPGLSPEVRERRLEELLSAAGEAGIEVSRDRLDQFDPERATLTAAEPPLQQPSVDSEDGTAAETGPEERQAVAEPEHASQEQVDPAALDAILVESGRNLVTRSETPTKG